MDEVVGDVASSSKSVSIARSSAPVDLAFERMVYVVDCERLRIGRRGDGAVVDDDEEYLDSEREIDLPDIEGKRTLLPFAGFSGFTVPAWEVASSSSSSA